MQTYDEKAENGRKRKLEKKLVRVFRWWPEQARVSERMCEEGFFLVNPAKKDEGPDTCFYWDWDEVKPYLAEHPRAQLWSVTEDEGTQYLWERFRWVNRMYYLVQDPAYKGDLTWRQRQVKPAPEAAELAAIAEKEAQMALAIEEEKEVAADFEERDAARVCEFHGCDVVFVPTEKSRLPDGTCLCPKHENAGS